MSIFCLGPLHIIILERPKGFLHVYHRKLFRFQKLHFSKMLRVTEWHLVNPIMLISHCISSRDAIKLKLCLQIVWYPFCWEYRFQLRLTMAGYRGYFITPDLQSHSKVTRPSCWEIENWLASDRTLQDVVLRFTSKSTTRLSHLIEIIWSS